jgi:L-ascorbate metabolism protein UlaG (beta-lactamase superfamily)
MVAKSQSQPKRAPWRERNFITEVIIPSLFQKRSGRKPAGTPVFPKLADGEICLTWIGHASFLLQTPRHNILIDPNWANWLLVVRRLKHAGIEIHQLPNIDLVLITHAHFDHLNRKTLRTIAEEQPIVVPDGVGGLVHNLGFEKIHEMQWWDHWNYLDINLTFVPAAHWGARRVVDNHRGYGGYLIEFGGRSLYACGDTAWFDGFEEIGKRFSPEICLIPIGAYDNPSGRDHHITPEQAVEAFLLLKSEKMIPMHYGTYRLSFEPIDEPPERLKKAAAEKGILPQVHFLTEGVPTVF